MNSPNKFILCLALVLSGGLFGCSTTKHTGVANANSSVKMKITEPWEGIAIKLVVAGSSGLGDTKSKTEEIKVKMAEYKFMPKPNSGIAPDGIFSMLEIHNPFTKKFCFVDPGHDFYVFDNSTMKGFTIAPGGIIWSSSYLELSDSNYNADTAIAQFEKEFNPQKLNAEWKNRETNQIGFLHSFPKEYLSDESTPNIDGIDLTDGILRLDIQNLDAKKPATIWIDLKAKKVTKTVVDGQEMDLNAINTYKNYAVPLKKN